MMLKNFLRLRMNRWYAITPLHPSNASPRPSFRNASNLDIHLCPRGSPAPDAYLISFGMRNVTNPTKALKQALRVLRRGGRFMMLEFAKVDNPIAEQLYDAYSFNLIPSIGEAVTGDRASYTYLVESIRKFPEQEEFGAMMEDTGFRSVQKENLSFGVVCQYSGFKL
mmetsp:Transcript_34509/g.135735  ORF Transcript_34509/g.135735 Transcript_34509/m.135735 type:complete len:167 (+) Transcript_34509:916-1416(+)